MPISFYYKSEAGKSFLNGRGNGVEMKKVKNESALLKEALRVGSAYIENRGAGSFEAHDSSGEKIHYLYRVLVHDRLLQPLAKGQESEPNIRHKLALWIARQLPEGHHLLR